MESYVAPDGATAPPKRDAEGAATLRASAYSAVIFLARRHIITIERPINMLE